MKNTVAGLLFSTSMEHIVLIRKNQPEWMAGLWNAVGGKVETFDLSPRHAMTREFKEETGLLISPTQWERFTILATRGGDIHWFTAKSFAWASVKTNEKELVAAFSRNALINEEIPMMPNLLWLYEMARAYHTGKDSCISHHVTEVGYSLSV